MGRKENSAYSAERLHAIGSYSFAKAKPAGSPERIAIPVAADSEQDRKVAMALAAADRARLPKRRNLSFAAFLERIEGSGGVNPDAIVRLSRALFM